MKHEWPRTRALSVVVVSRHPELERNASRQKAERLVKHLPGAVQQVLSGRAGPFRVVSAGKGGRP